MSGRFDRLGVAAVSLLLVLGVGGCGGGTGRDFADPAGDVKGGAGPDLTRVSVSHTASTVTFRFRFAKRPPLAANAEGGVDMLVAGIDVPPRSLKRSANGWSGLDYFAGLHGTEKTAVVVKASPAGPSQPNRVLARPEVTVSGHTLSFSIRRGTLGDPAWIELVVAAGRESSGEAGGRGWRRGAGQRHLPLPAAKLSGGPRDRPPGGRARSGTRAEHARAAKVAALMLRDGVAPPPGRTRRPETERVSVAQPTKAVIRIETSTPGSSTPSFAT